MKTRKTKKKNIEKHVKEINQIIVDQKKRHHLLKWEILKNIKKIKVVIVNYNFHYQQVGDVRVPYRRRSSWNELHCHMHEMSHATAWLVTNHCIRMITWHCCIDVITTSICCRNKLATWFKRDLVLLPWKGVCIIVVCGVLSARKPIASRDRGSVYLIHHAQCISRLYCRPIYYTF